MFQKIHNQVFHATFICEALNIVIVKQKVVRYIITFSSHVHYNIPQVTVYTSLAVKK